MKISKKIISLLLAVLLSLSVPIAGFAQEADTTQEIDLQSSLVQAYYKQITLAYLYQIIDYIDANYRYEVSRDRLYQIAIENMAISDKYDFDSIMKDIFSTLDEYSAYYTKEEFQGLVTNITGTLVGIGVTIMEENGQIVVISPIEGSPAQRAGIKPNDIIKTVNGMPVDGLSTNAVASYIRGEAGTKVKIGIKRAGIPNIIEFEITREVIEQNPVSYKILDGNIGYLKISDFNDNTKKYVEKALAEFDKVNVKKVIIDLRNNPGGTLESVLELANIFLPEGLVATISYKDETKNEKLYSTNKNPKYKLALLVNEGSASASELFAGAVQDMKAGKLFGQTTYGKGSVQAVSSLVTGSGFKLTIAQYLTPSGRSIHKVGVTPDEVVKNTYRQITEDDFIKLDLSRTYALNDSGEGVLAIKQRLKFLGLIPDFENDIYDEATKDAVSFFQISNNVEPTGVCDLNTLILLNNIIYEGYEEIDNQLEAALNYLKGLN